MTADHCHWRNGPSKPGVDGYVQTDGVGQIGGGDYDGGLDDVPLEPLALEKHPLGVVLADAEYNLLWIIETAEL
ncbi:hypothetical protein [Arthrobacter sp. CAN_C5]|uniref:hypothetical protein n=1 Tax=Arthrobacter sp. CAN_C5 TaxID=2760706 RepID=UPI001AE2A6EA|nr:hypothetical protein [Arthrobacter sp. CAN_C5]MBP2217105.1 hypothetical protein [Arthrobacter sp. CAN_C5]